MRRRRKIERKLNTQMRKKLVILFGMVLLALVGLVLKISVINATEGDQYSKQVLMQTQQQYTSRVIPCKRGDIYDKNGNVLATSSKVYNVILDCKAINSDPDYAEPTTQALVSIFGADESKIQSLLTGDKTKESQYQILMKEVSVEQKKEFDEYTTVEEDSDLSEEEKTVRENVQGVWFEETYHRSYPFTSLACDTIGFTFDAETADWGLEGYYNDTLNGTDGRQYGYFNDSADVEQSIIEPTNGNSIVTTLDVGAQNIVEKYVDGFQEAMGAANIGVIVEDPSTGEILAMDGGDRYDLNEPRDMSSIYTEEQVAAMNDEEEVEALNSMWRNYCITDAFEPGSTVKPFVMAAALEKGAIQEDDSFTCDGYQMIGDTQIKCAAYPGAHGTETLQEVIANSCNDAMMQIAERMGTEQFIKTQSLFNFGTRTGIDLPNEGTGIMHTEDSMGVVELACSAFGQGFTCTMIQEINAICSVINGGYYYQPHVVKKILDADGGTVENIGATLVRQTVSEKTSSLIRQYLYHTMYGEADSNGNNATGRNARVAGYAMGGKTGTAQKIPRSDRKYLVSFIGFAPVDNPQVVCYVVVDEPNAADATAQASSSFAQEIFKNIMTEAMPYLNIYATEEIPADMQDEVDAQKAAEEESGSTEEGTEEETAEEELPEGTLIDPNTGETVTMPTEEELESEDAGDMMGGIDSPILPADGSEADTGEEDASQ